MDKWLRSVWFIRGISLVLACLLWVTVNLDDNMDSNSLLDDNSIRETMNNIPLEVRFDSEEYIVSGLPQDVSVTVEGQKSTITPVVRQKNFSIFANLEGLGPGTHEVTLQHSGISNQLDVQIDPEVIEVTIEEKVSDEYPVEVDFNGEADLDETLVLGEPEVEPAEVTVTGSASVMEQIAAVRAIVDVGSVTETIEDAEAPVKVYDGEGNELNVLVDPNTVTVTVPVSKRSKAVPIELIPDEELAEGLVLDTVTSATEQVTVFGSESALEGLEVLEVPVNLAEVTEDTTIEVELPLPEGVTSVDPETIEVAITVSEVEQANNGTDQESEPAGTEPSAGEATSTDEATNTEENTDGNDTNAN